MTKDEALHIALEALTFDGYTPSDETHRAIVSKAITAIKQAELSWQPIETAPKDKTHVALLRQNGDGSVTYGHGFYMPMEGWICWTHYGNKPPTHWMQLPPAP